MERFMSLDLGDKRIGVAVSDPFNTYALPLETYHRQNLKKDLEYVLAVAKEKRITTIVCGLPVNFDGTESVQTGRAQYFIDRLREQTTIPVVTADERCTTMEAHRTLIEEDYSEILSYHQNNQNELTVVAAVKTLSIPYGTIVTGENGILESIEEKPTLSFKINTGLYILEPSLLNDIPDDFYHITHLMEKLKMQGRRVGVYPISQNDWKDMGEWTEYLRMIKVL